MSFFHLVLTGFIGVHLYLFVCLTRLFGFGLWQVPVAVLFLVGLSFWVFPGIWQSLPGDRGLTFVGFTWLGFSIIAALCCFGADVLSIILRLAPAGTQPFAAITPRQLLSAGLLVSILISGYAVFEARHLRTRHVVIETTRFPAGSRGLRLAVVSDVHLGRLIGADYLERVVRRVEEAGPDVFISLGDLVDTDMTSRDRDAALLRELEPPLGRFGVQGNHEYYRGIENARRFEENAGLTMIDGRIVPVGPVWLAGLDDPMGGAWSEKVGDLADRIEAVRAQDPRAVVILLSHRPNVPAPLAGLADLQLSGHTHGGQIWPGRWLTKRANGDLPNGLSELPSRTPYPSRVYVTNGAGFWGPPMRFLAPPEVLIIDVIPRRCE